MGAPPWRSHRVFTPVTLVNTLIDPPEFLSQAELARRWKVHMETVRRLRKDGLRAVAVGRRVLYRLSDILKYEHTHSDK